MTAQESVLMTSCSDGGLGAALATTFHERGYRVFETPRSLKTMSKVSELPGVLIIQLDATNATDIQAAKTALDENTEDAKLIHETNVWCPLAETQVFAPVLIKANGNIVFITSVAGHLNTTEKDAEHLRSKYSW